MVYLAMTYGINIALNINYMRQFILFYNNMFNQIDSVSANSLSEAKEHFNHEWDINSSSMFIIVEEVSDWRDMF